MAVQGKHAGSQDERIVAVGSVEVCDMPFPSSAGASALLEDAALVYANMEILDMWRIQQDGQDGADAAAAAEAIDAVNVSSVRNHLVVLLEDTVALLRASGIDDIPSFLAGGRLGGEADAEED